MINVLLRCLSVLLRRPWPCSTRYRPAGEGGGKIDCMIKLLRCRGLSTVFALLVILLWRKFPYDKSASEMLINPRIVFTFIRQRWRITYHLQFISSLAGVKIEYTSYNSSTYFLFSQQRNILYIYLRSFF
jgi:hypothetical protein